MKKESKIINNSLPLVSVIMPTFNTSRYLVGALDSLLKQTYSNWELIAVDDASNDDSFLILKQYSQLDSRIKVYKNAQNMGVGKTRNFAVSKAKGQFIAVLDSDDLAYSNRFLTQIEYLLLNPAVVAVGSQAILINEENNNVGVKTFPTKHNDLYNLMYTAIPIQQSALMINKALLPKNFTWYNDLRVAEDTDLYFRLVNFGKIVNLPNTLIKYRIYNNSTSLKDPKKTFTVTWDLRKKAVKEYNYKPTLKSILISNFQYIVVNLLPNFLVYPLFKLVRGALIYKNTVSNGFNIVSKKVAKKAEVFVAGLL